MDFSSASHGASATGMETYKQDLRTNVFEKLRNALNDINDIKTAVSQGWVGTAADNFIANVITGANTLRDNVNVIEDSINQELDGAISQVYDMDENLVELD